MKNKLKAGFSGAALALAAASLVGCSSMGMGMDAGSADSGGTAELVHCYGVSKCKGLNDCKTADNACAGKASCKGHGFVAMNAKACTDVGGKTNDNWRGTISKSDLIHCYGVNKCGGHNDCKTADNACAGKASCSGKGFVNASAKSCESIGGKKGA